MASLIVVWWRDIPAQVIVKKGRASVKKPLADRFQLAIDRAAMRAGRGSSDAYLADWRRSAPESVGDELEAEALAAVQRLEADYDEARLLGLVRAKGVDAAAAGGSA